MLQTNTKPKIRLGIIGSRSWEDYSMFCIVINAFRQFYDIEYIVSGGAIGYKKEGTKKVPIGADHYANQYAKQLGLGILTFYPNYNVPNRKQAPLERNSDIVDYSGFIIAFWDGVSTGTKDTIDKAMGRKPILIVKPDGTFESYCRFGINLDSMSKNREEFTKDLLKRLINMG